MGETISDRCMHCGLRKANSSRGICGICSSDVDVRELYPRSTEAIDFACRGHSLGNKVMPLPPKPTDALPGTEAKMRVMRQRAADGFHIHHPHDARWDDARTGCVPKVSTVDEASADEESASNEEDDDE